MVSKNTIKSKSLPGNKYLRIALNGVVLDIYGNDVSEKYVKDKKITYEFFNKMRTFDLKYAIMLAWFEAGDLENLEQQIDNIIFYPVENAILNRITRHIMFFKQPIYYDKEFRIVPGLVRYAVNKNGSVLDIKRNKLLNIQESATMTYKSVLIYNPDSSHYISYHFHRMYALAWLENDMKEIRHFINHKDGNKRNCSLDNLEWCTHSENVNHALDTGLSDTRVRLKIRDRWTGEVRHFKSAEEILLLLGIPANCIKRYISDMQPWYLVKGKYEIKTEDDTTPWFYEQEMNKYFVSGKAIIVYTVVDSKTGKTYKFNRFEAIFKAFGIKSVKFYENNAAAKINKLNKLYPHLSFSYEIRSLSGPYIVINIKTNERFVTTSIVDIEKKIGIDRNRIRKDFVRKDRYIYNKKWVCYPANEENIIDLKTFKEFKKNPHYEVTNLETNETKIYKSLSEIDMLLKIDKGTAAKAIAKNEGRTYKRGKNGEIINFYIRPLPPVME